MHKREKTHLQTDRQTREIGQETPDTHDMPGKNNFARERANGQVRERANEQVRERERGGKREREVGGKTIKQAGV